MTASEPDIIEKWRDGVARMLANLPSRGAENESAARISAAYSRLTESERRDLQPLIDEWVLSDNAGVRFDALSVVRKNRVVDAIPALRQLAERLEQSDDIHDIYEWKRVNSIIGGLIEQTHRE